MYAIMNNKNECVGIIGNYRGAVREAKKIGAKCVRKVNISSVDASLENSVWKSGKSGNTIINKLLAVILFVIAFVAGFISYKTGEAFDASILFGFFGLIMFFYRGNIFA